MIQYQKAVKEIFELQIFAIKLGLDNITALCRNLGDPQNAYPVIHIAGTNGKGSTAFYIAKLLQAHGLKTGLYTSPHLYDFRERIQVNNKKISQEYILSFWEKMKRLVMSRKATFFDTTTAMAFDYFNYKNVDAAVIETGLGGRLDSTNIVEPCITIITPVNYDHQKQLGNSLASIMTEKCGIIKNNSVVFSARQKSEGLETLKKHLNESNEFYYLPETITVKIRERNPGSVKFNLSDSLNRIKFENLRTNQTGDFQAANIALAYFAGRRYLEMTAVKFDENKLREVLYTAQWPGRLELLREQPGIFFDVSHNLQGIRNSLKYLAQVIDTKKLVILLGLVQDKNYHEIVKEIAAYSSIIYITEPDTHRKLDAEELAAAFEHIDIKVNIIKEPQKAYEISSKSLNNDEYLLVTGSHYLIGSLK